MIFCLTTSVGACLAGLFLFSKTSFHRLLE